MVKMTSMREYIFWWIAKPDQFETEEHEYFPSAQHARAYAAKILRTETIAPYGRVYYIKNQKQNMIPYNAKLVQIIHPVKTEIILFKNRLYVEKVRKNTKGQYYQVFYPMSADGVVSNRSVRSLM